MGEDTGIKIRSIFSDHFFARGSTKEWKILKIPEKVKCLFSSEKDCSIYDVIQYQWMILKIFTSQTDRSIFSNQLSWYS